MTVRRSAVAAATLALLAAGCGGGNDDEPPASASPSTQGCESVEAPAPRADGGATAPTEPLAEGITYRLTFATSCGEFTVTLDPESAPRATASLVALARSGFYDDTTIHRVSPNFVIQGGDPTGDGTGGPGYQTVDTPPRDAAYTRGVFAMAKAQDDPPGAAGSQWFVITTDAAQLPPDYAIAGTVTDGLDVVDRIGAIPSDPVTEAPSQTVVVDTVTVTES